VSAILEVHSLLCVTKTSCWKDSPLRLLTACGRCPSVLRDTIAADMLLCAPLSNAKLLTADDCSDGNSAWNDDDTNRLEDVARCSSVRLVM